MTTAKTIALTRWTFVDKVMSLPFNMLSWLVIASKEQASFNFMVAITICSDFGAQENKDCHCFWRARSKSRVLHKTPSTQHHQKRANHLNHLSGPTPEHIPTLIPFKEQARHPLPCPREWASEAILFSLPAAAAGAPIKPCLNFLSSLWSISID